MGEKNPWEQREAGVLTTGKVSPQRPMLWEVCEQVLLCMPLEFKKKWRQMIIV